MPEDEELTAEIAENAERSVVGSCAAGSRELTFPARRDLADAGEIE